MSNARGRYRNDIKSVLHFVSKKQFLILLLYVPSARASLVSPCWYHFVQKGGRAGLARAELTEEAGRPRSVLHLQGLRAFFPVQS